MEKASRDLMNEHRAILVTLDIIEKMYERIRDNIETESDDIKEIIDFLKVFADKCHHGKEEDYLFPAYEKAGIERENGPIGIALEQHRMGREFIRQMEKSVENRKIRKEAFVKAASGYVDLLRMHIEKEDTLMFPYGDARLTDAIQKQLLRDFENLEQNVIGEGKHEELHTMLKKFKNKYLPN
jgi:hemerythrin-like domain-containing protein